MPSSVLIQSMSSSFFSLEILRKSSSGFHRRSTHDDAWLVMKSIDNRTALISALRLDRQQGSTSIKELDVASKYFFVLLVLALIRLDAAWRVLLVQLVLSIRDSTFFLSQEQCIRCAQSTPAGRHELKND